jgi:hypothetical protein
MNLLWMGAYIWILVGIAEETLYRGMIQTYLMRHLNGQIRIIKWDFKMGTLIAAIWLFPFKCPFIAALGNLECNFNNYWRSGPEISLSADSLAYWSGNSPQFIKRIGESPHRILFVVFLKALISLTNT